jgi:hypothetical protein
MSGQHRVNIQCFRYSPPLHTSCYALGCPSGTHRHGWDVLFMWAPSNGDRLSDCILTQPISLSHTKTSSGKPERYSFWFVLGDRSCGGPRVQERLTFAINLGHVIFLSCRPSHDVPEGPHSCHIGYLFQRLCTWEGTKHITVFVSIIQDIRSIQWNALISTQCVFILYGWFQDVSLTERGSILYFLRWKYHLFF